AEFGRMRECERDGPLWRASVACSAKSGHRAACRVQCIDFDQRAALSPPLWPAHIGAMAEDHDPNAPERPKRDPAKPAKKDARKAPARPARARAAGEQRPPIAPALEKLLNPGIERGTAGPGSQTGLQPPPDNSFDRRADFAAAHRARASTQGGFKEAPQKGY